jgi:hypothetical protein
VRRLLVQVGDDEFRLICSDPSRFIIPGQELDGIPAGQERETGVVLNGTLGEFKGRCIAQLDVHVVADVADGKASGLVFDLAYKIDQRMLGSKMLGQR